MVDRKTMPYTDYHYSRMENTARNICSHNPGQTIQRRIGVSLSRGNHPGISATTNLVTALRKSGTCIVARDFIIKGLALAPKCIGGTMINPKTIGLNGEFFTNVSHLEMSVKWAEKEKLDETGKRYVDMQDAELMVTWALDHYLVDLGMWMMERVPGPHFTFVDPRLRDNSYAMITQAKHMMSLLNKKGGDPERLILTIPATEAGVAASRALQLDYEIQTNLNLVTGLTHAAVCAEAMPTTINICLNDLLQAAHSLDPGHEYVFCSHISQSPTIRMVQAINAYFKKHGIKTEVMISDPLKSLIIGEFCDIQQLSGLGTIALTEAEFMKMTCSQLPLYPAPTEDVLKGVSANEVQYPTGYGDTGCDFSKLLSTHEYALFQAVMHTASNDMSCMENLVADLRATVHRLLYIPSLKPEVNHVSKPKPDSPSSSFEDEPNHNKKPTGRKAVLESTGDDWGY